MPLQMLPSCSEPDTAAAAAVAAARSCGATAAALSIRLVKSLGPAQISPAVRFEAAQAVVARKSFGIRLLSLANHSGSGGRRSHAVPRKSFGIRLPSFANHSGLGGRLSQVIRD